MKKIILLAGLITLLSVMALGTAAQDAAPARAQDLGYRPPRHYVSYRATGPVTVDGRLDDKAWQAVPWMEPFVDIEGQGKPAPRFQTRVKMIWDDQFLYFGAQMEEPHVWGTMTKHDSLLYLENNFELFIDPAGSNHNYAEFEINPLNTGWDLLLKKPYRDGGPADSSWEIAGLKTAVHVDGTVNDPRDTDKGWSVEIAVPWNVLAKLSSQPAPPRDGDQWRLNFQRYEWPHEIVDGKYRKVKNGQPDVWVWSPHGVIDIHRPELWGYVQFATGAPGTATFRPDIAGPAKHLLHRIYYAQSKFRKDNKRYAATLSELGLGELTHESLLGPPQLEIRQDGYTATAEVRVEGGQGKKWRIRQDSLVEAVKE